MESLCGPGPGLYLLWVLKALTECNGCHIPIIVYNLNVFPQNDLKFICCPVGEFDFIKKIINGFYFLIYVGMLKKSSITGLRCH